MPVYRISGEAKVLELMLKTISSGTDAGPLKCARRGADVLISVAGSSKLGPLWADFEVPELTGKQIMLDPSVEAIREFASLSEAVGARLKQSLVRCREPVPQSVIVSISGLQEWRVAVEDALRFRGPEIGYLPYAVAGRILLRLVKPPPFLVHRWRRKGYTVYTPAEAPNVYVAWGWTLALPWMSVPSARVLLVDEKGNYAFLPSDFEDLQHILKLTLNGAQEWRPEKVEMGALEVPLRLVPGQTLSDPSLWQAERDQILAVLSTVPQRLLRMMSVGRFRGAPEGEVWILEYHGAPHPRLSQEIGRLTRPNGIAFASAGVPWLFVPVGYTLQPVPSMKTLSETFLGEEGTFTDLILLMPGEGPLNVVRLALSGFLPAEEVLRYSVEQDVCALKEHHEMSTEHMPELSDFVKLLAQPPRFWEKFVSRFRRMRRPVDGKRADSRKM
ncbi:MAG: hypothetical protein V2G42_07410 [bacterium JZ-2024 1]